MDGSDEKRAAEVVRQEDEDGNRYRLSLVVMEERTANIFVVSRVCGDR